MSWIAIISFVSSVILLILVISLETETTQLLEHIKCLEQKLKHRSNDHGCN
jgi:hypothetical protein